MTNKGKQQSHSPSLFLSELERLYFKAKLYGLHSPGVTVTFKSFYRSLQRMTLLLQKHSTWKLEVMPLFSLYTSVSVL